MFCVVHFTVHSYMFSQICNTTDKACLSHISNAAEHVCYGQHNVVMFFELGAQIDANCQVMNVWEELRESQGSGLAGRFGEVKVEKGERERLGLQGKRLEIGTVGFVYDYLDEGT